MSRLICYCFGYTEEDLCQDVLRHGRSSSIPGASDTGPSMACGRSLIMERIVAEKKDGHCRCAEANPTGH
ncbi:MAG: hypothetical protein Q8R42_02730 [Desulfocapsaceae bacterium]|jgi:hypothetical protein|nr:hypothetical protein [Desulfocapsaceae bacterium]